MTKFKTGLVYEIIVSNDGVDLPVWNTPGILRKYPALKLGRTGMKSKVIKDENGHRLQSRRVWTGSYA